MNALTKGFYGYGHGVSYFAQGLEYSHAEIFANLTDLLGRKDLAKFIKAKEAFPDIVEDYMDSIKDLIAKLFGEAFAKLFVQAIQKAMDIPGYIEGGGDYVGEEDAKDFAGMLMLYSFRFGEAPPFMLMGMWSATEGEKMKMMDEALKNNKPLEPTIELDPNVLI